MFANSASEHGAGIYNSDVLLLTNSTIAANETVGSGGGIHNEGSGQATLTNTIVAGNRRGSIADDIGNSVGSLSSFNLIGDSTTSGGLSDGLNGNIVGVDWKTVLVNNGVVPLLRDNGGLTRTIAVLAGGPAIDAGSDAKAVDSNGNPLTTDQRGAGFGRVLAEEPGGTPVVDIGAFEFEPARFIVAIAEDTISEDSGTSTVTVTRSSDTAGQIVMTLSSSDTGEATVPETVVIPAGQSSATATLTGVPDDLADSTQTVTITATALGYATGIDTVDVSNVDAAFLSVAIGDSSIREDSGTTTVTIFRNSEATDELTVTLFSSDYGEATLPATVTIPAGQNSAVATITGVKDSLVDSTQVITITATAEAHASGQGSLSVVDVDIPALTLIIDQDSITEDSGSTIATISRNTSTAAQLVVTLTSSDPGEAITTATITIPAGQATTEFTISGVADSIVDGTETVTITAMAEAHEQQSDTVDVVNTDVPALFVEIAAESVTENFVGTHLTVVRNFDTTTDLVVSLSSSDPGEATVPGTVTIRAGNTSALAVLTGVLDYVFDETQTVTITASADGYTMGSDTIQVTNVDPPPDISGDVDGDGDFDANDSFLMHLVKLSGTDTQIDQVRGNSPRAAADIRSYIANLNTIADVDGDEDFDGNDSFLILLIKLSGTHAQIEQSKGASVLAAQQISWSIRVLFG
ncbi:choice-of-anchor Q domain-containing protein [Fuerstiella marisgermanici]|uniref:Calx-beta domain-containing protein n=1 Tax=Fuerstiella marisgermanici TaxID=1891926 RepID=A0A1P8WMA1_9PLAN|nr:choice-of-anchor Q domain-containing protein [Fuerstiella marisgermanici]APZ95180.1 hypothetical protein Fuma_04835 [Fuerstiella marisgermanici]